MSTERHITQERLKELFTLNEQTGILYWKKRVSHSRAGPGDVAGYSSSSSGYWTVKVDGKLHLRSRLVFLFVNGYLPKEVDHRNRIKHDDRPCNLREATTSLNKANTLPKRGRRWPKGVYHRGYGGLPFYAQITVAGRRIALGSFPSAELAYAAYQNAAREHFGEFACFAEH